MFAGTPRALLGLFVIVGYALYASSKRKPHDAILVALFLAVLWGPETAVIDFPAFPPLQKESLVLLTLFLTALAKWGRFISRAGFFSVWEVLVLVSLFGPVGTALANPDAMHTGPPWAPLVIPGLTLNDGLNEGIKNFLSVGVPFLLGRWFFRTPGHLDRLLTVLVIEGFAQTAVLLIELRFSPQIHGWVYGESQIIMFNQTMRWGGWRPTGFMEHGLALAMFMLAAFLAASILTRENPNRRSVWNFPIRKVTWYLGIMLVLCKSTGAIFYMIPGMYLVRKATAKMMVRVAVVLALFCAIYPLLRVNDMVPVDDVVQLIEENLGEDRAGSLKFRFNTEGALIKHSSERPLFGWGSYGRGFVHYDENGDSYLVVDGYWVIVMSSMGYVGYVACFGLLVGAVLLMARRYGRVVDPTLQLKLAGFTSMLAWQVFDYIPNGCFSPYPYLLAGALVGFGQEILKPNSEWRRVPAAPQTAG